MKVIRQWIVPVVGITLIAIAWAAALVFLSYAFAQSSNDGGVQGSKGNITGPQGGVVGPSGGVTGPAGGLAGPGGRPAGGGGGSCAFGALDFSQSGCNIAWMGG